jgi:thioredoxin-like negative regulator of GroEL
MIFKFLILLFLAVQATKTRITKEQLDQLAQEADEKILFVTPANFEEFISSGAYRLVFFGAKWCKYCKKLTPKWLKLEQGMSVSSLYKDKDIKLAKLDCTEDEGFCAIQGAEGYPTVLFYHNGKRLEEYMGDHTTKDIAEYLLAKMTYLEEEKTQRERDEL